MCKKTQKLALVRDGELNPYHIDNKWLNLIVGKSVRKMHSTTMYQKTNALRGFMGKKSKVCISLNPKELSPKSGGSEKTEDDLPRYPRKQCDLAQSDKMCHGSMLMIKSRLFAALKNVLQKKRVPFCQIKAGMLLKTHIEKMSPFCLSTIFMKTKEI